MKTITSLLLLFCASLPVCAQSEDSTITLSEVVVNAAKVINKADGKIVFPSEVQKTSSSNGFGLLQKMSFPNIRIDAINHLITSIDQRGSVQVRLNGIIADSQMLLSLDPTLILRIEFIDKPGLRYGDGIGYVIYVITRRPSAGYTLGFDATASLTSRSGNGMIYGKLNKGKSEFSLSYNLNGNDLKGLRNDETAQYTLSDGTITTIQRNDLDSHSKLTSHNINMVYNLADTTAYTFQISLSEAFSHTPTNDRTLSIITNNTTSLSRNWVHSSSHSPVLDIYFFRQLTPQQSLTSNVVGTYISTDKHQYTDEGESYQFDVDGHSESLWAETVYENRLNPFTLSTGINYRYKRIRNHYSGDAMAQADIYRNDLYAFSEISGVLKAFQYVAGLGLSHIYSWQNEHRYNFWTLRPKLTLAYTFSPRLQINYSFLLQNRDSRIATTSNTSFRTNSMEWTAGNPDLKPSRDIEQMLTLFYSTNRVQLMAEGFYRQCFKPNMADYERTPDNQFIYTQTNQKRIDLLYTMISGNWSIIPNQLEIGATGGIQRCFNYGHTYEHLYTSYFYSASAKAYLGPITITAYIDNGSRFLEGENKGFNEAYSLIQASYMYKDWQLSASWVNPFCTHHTMYRSELLNRNLHKFASGYSTDSGNQFLISLTWRFSRGHQHKSAQKTIQLRDTDAGIL